MTRPEVADIPNRRRLDSRDPDIPICHRTALGIIRSSFSIAVISRFADYERPLNELNRTTINAADRQGPIERYRNTIQQLLNAVVRSERESEEPPERALYPDEITWLYNERALVSYLQGRLYDALPLFNQAIEANRETEGDSDGPTRRRILLNKSLADIERGHLRRAQDQLEKLYASSSEGLVSVIAGGYLGLVDHLEGRLTLGEKHYKSAVKSLTKHRRYRAVSIFKRHLADLHRARGNIGEAKECLQHAVAAAEAGGQQDILHYARIAEARVYRGKDARRAIYWLDLAERYADSMDIPKMKAEVWKVRGDIMLAQGENKLAGELAVASLGVCSLHGMTLRKVSALILMGQVTAHRRNPVSAERMMLTARRIAERHGYQLKVERAQRALLETDTMLPT